MATASQSQSSSAAKLARLKAQQESEAERRKQNDLLEKERTKKEQWEKFTEKINTKDGTLPEKVVKPALAEETKTKVLQPVSPGRMDGGVDDRLDR
jgi:hypothetical protein